VLHHILSLQLFTSLINKRKILLCFVNSVINLLSKLLLKLPNGTSHYKIILYTPTQLLTFILVKNLHNFLAVAFVRIFYCRKNIKSTNRIFILSI